MQFARLSKVLAGVAVMVITTAVASADVMNKKTTMTVKETIEVPGAVLQPGEYVVKLVDSQANRHIVQFLNKEEDEVLSTVIAIPNSRMEPTGETQFEWYETPAGQPPALRAWFYPGDSFGQEFAYPEGRATELSAEIHQEVPHVSDDEAAMAAKQADKDETVIAQTPARTPEPQENERQAQQDRDRQATQEAAQIAQQNRDREATAQRERDLQQERQRQAAQTAQNQQRTADPNLTAQQTQNQQTNELPETAGLGALLALIGLGSLGASKAVRKLRSR
jgi:hypothetical protein